MISKHFMFTVNFLADIPPLIVTFISKHFMFTVNIICLSNSKYSLAFQNISCLRLICQFLKCLILQNIFQNISCLRLIPGFYRINFFIIIISKHFMFTVNSSFNQSINFGMVFQNISCLRLIKNFVWTFYWNQIHFKTFHVYG